MLYHKLKCDFVFYEDHLKILRLNHKDTINMFEIMRNFKKQNKGTSLAKVH